MTEHPGEQLRSEERAADRLIFFSDAVVAIAMTLLALDLPVPTGATAAQLWKSIHGFADNYLAFVISFTVIAATWSRHHYVFRYAERTDQRLRTLNMTWLLVMVLNPFATRLLTSEGHDSLGAHAIRFGFYAGLQVVASAVFLLMVHRIASAGLGSDDIPADIFPDQCWELAGVLIAFGASIPLFLVFRDAWLVWIVVPLGLAQVRRYRRRRALVSRDER
ncbi:uncharacterized protein DUF1211 [Jatrophihabitans sp. GAS493]|uniref:TMEM175 family protein n=1 Tax=Jatrophihabitans sp. GAS493 TaxID=1907575 RepID=UPI000BB85F75|nr:TMEM175 family protein [Jatrophihabitans sp. GAS493]SOD70731.1 uncharacterized protein DUF1211 [Jatrophihabitans sp. GAS493]